MLVPARAGWLVSARGEAGGDGFHRVLGEHERVVVGVRDGLDAQPRDLRTPGRYHLVRQQAGRLAQQPGGGGQEQDGQAEAPQRAADVLAVGEHVAAVIPDGCSATRERTAPGSPLMS